MHRSHPALNPSKYLPKNSFLWGLLLCACVIVILLLQPSPAAMQQTRDLVLDSDTIMVKLGSFMEYTPAPSSATRPEHLTSDLTDWQQSQVEAISLGYQSSPHWFRSYWHTNSQIEEDWVLEINNSHLDNIELFLYQNGQQLQYWQTGDSLTYDQRPVDHPMFLFPVQLQPDSEYALYIRIRNTEAMELPARLLSRDHYITYNTLRSWIDGIFNGFLIIMAAYSLALFAILKDKTYLFYISYIFSMLLFFLYQQGLLFRFVYPSWPLVQHYFPLFISLYIFLSIALFFRALLELPKLLPRHWAVYKTLLMLHGTYCLLFWVLDYQTAMYLLIVNTLLSTLMAASSIITLAMRGSRSAQIVLMGWALLLFFLIIFTAAKTGLIYNEFMAVYGLRIGISIEILIFSFALSFRINQERQEKEQALQQANLERSEKLEAQELALQREIEANQAKESALQIEIKHREDLEKVVEERTSDLEQTLQELEKSNQELALLSSKDSLTGLYNRRLFDMKLKEYWSLAQRNQQSLSLLIIDIDHFKQINDTRGHQCGDYVLERFSRLLTETLHRPSDFIARYGGEEFAILLADTPLAGAEKIADKIVEQTANQDFNWAGETFRISVSIGIATQHPPTTQAPGSLVSNADAALYQAKHRGRNRWISFI